MSIDNKRGFNNIGCIMNNAVSVLVWVVSLYMRWGKPNLIKLIGFIVSSAIREDKDTK